MKADSSNEFERWRLHAANGMDHMQQCVLKIADVAMASCRSRANTRWYCALLRGEIFQHFADSLESHVLWVYCSHGRRLPERQIGDMQGTSDGVRVVRSALGGQKTTPLLRKPQCLNA